VCAGQESRARAGDCSNAGLYDDEDWEKGRKEEIERKRNRNRKRGGEREKEKEIDRGREK
jgi:hypothetical protein